MAIFDNDGTVNREVGKVYSNDGAVSGEVDKVYDNDGTVNSLVYESEIYLYRDGDQCVDVTGGWAGYTQQGGVGYGFGPTQLALSLWVAEYWVGGYSGYGNIHTNKTIDFTEINELNAIISHTGTSAGNGFITITKNAYVTSSPSSSDVYRSYPLNTTQQIKIDTHALTGHWYVLINGYCSQPQGQQKHLSATKIWLK